MDKLDNKTRKIEITDVFEDNDEDLVYFYVSDNGRGCWQNIEVDELKKYLPEKEYDFDKEIEGAICKWVNDNLDISKLPNIEDATPAMRLLYKRVSTSENNMFYLDIEKGEDFNEIYGMTQEEFKRQVDSDVKKYNLENVIDKAYDGALYVCFGNLQSAFTEKVENYNVNEEKLDYENTKQPTFKDFFTDFKKMVNDYDKAGLGKKDIIQKMSKIFNDDKSLTQIMTK